jgi:hypothetical protein
VSIVENGNDAWNIETIVTLVSDSSNRLQVLTRDFDVFRWIDGDGEVSHRCFDLSFAGNNIIIYIDCMLMYVCMHTQESSVIIQYVLWIPDSCIVSLVCY